MTKRPYRSVETGMDHQPDWQAADADPLDWRFISKNPVREIVSNAEQWASKPRAANDNIGPRTLIDWGISLVLTTVIAVALCGAAAAAIAGLYVVKSALGIDLFAGHSFLHDWLYALK